MSQAYANSKGVKIVGDIPIYVGGQSADVWAYQDLFELGADGQPLIVSGVPPDAFSETGQLWGSPLYDWKVRSCEMNKQLLGQSLNKRRRFDSMSSWPDDAYILCKWAWEPNVGRHPRNIAGYMLFPLSNRFQT